MTTSRRIGSYTLKFEHWKHDNTCNTAKVGRWVVAFLTKRYPTFSTHSDWAKELSSNCIFWTPRLFFYSFPLEHTPRVLLPVQVFYGWMAQFFVLFAFHQIISFRTTSWSFLSCATCSFLSIYLLIMFLALLYHFWTLIRNATIFRLEKANGDCSCSLWALVFCLVALHYHYLVLNHIPGGHFAPPFWHCLALANY